MSERSVGMLFLGAGLQDEDVMPQRLDTIASLIGIAFPLVDTAKALPVLQMLTTLARCPPQFASQHRNFVVACCDSLCHTAHTLNATALVSLLRSLEKLDMPHRGLLKSVGYQLQIRQYDLPAEAARQAHSSFDVLRARCPSKLEGAWRPPAVTQST
eukprot:GDKI01037460.1.p1 GENE.GDKI01037460.1~~GDKI01037460.1.p1  ORF type:complete len:157 (-),score=28.07 GDKI01037460.1:241-711(-)